MITLTDMPDEIIGVIYQYIPWYQFPKLQNTSHTFNNIDILDKIKKKADIRAKMYLNFSIFHLDPIGIFKEEEIIYLEYYCQSKMTMLYSQTNRNY